MIQLFSEKFDGSLPISLYVQLYSFIKEEITSGRLRAGERLPSLRQAAKQSGLSLTTCSLAYEQLATEGYIFSKPQSGYYVSALPEALSLENASPTAGTSGAIEDYFEAGSSFLHDPETFDFRSWRKCVARVYTDCTEQLFIRGDVQGEAALRYEIARYVYESRGVDARPEQIVVGAGTQQLTAHLTRILKRMGIAYVCVEEPGYLPIRQIFRDGGFPLAEIPVGSEGILMDRLPVNLPSAVYVSPSNQFPTGAVMPVAKRYALLEWAAINKSVVIEDDYDSELRYFGQPIPALKGLDKEGRVVYLGSFAATLFPAIRISYMVLPGEMMRIFEAIKGDYSQTCSKAEQLALAYFMEEGAYASNIRKKRALYARKLSRAVRAFTQFGGERVRPLDTKSGISLLLLAGENLDTEAFCRRGAEMGLRILPLEEGGKAGKMIFYYNQVPYEVLKERIRELCIF